MCGWEWGGGGGEVGMRATSCGIPLTVSLDLVSVHVQYLNTQNSTITLSLQLLHKLVKCEELLRLYAVTSLDRFVSPVACASILNMC